MSIRVKPNICYEPNILYKPEFSYAPPQGYRAESFIIPFSFQVMANGEIQADNPWKLDDDVPWVFRGMVWPQVGTAEAVNAGGSGVAGLTGLGNARKSPGYQRKPADNLQRNQRLCAEHGSHRTIRLRFDQRIWISVWLRDSMRTRGGHSCSISRFRFRPAARRLSR